MNNEVELVDTYLQYGQASSTTLYPSIADVRQDLQWIWPQVNIRGSTMSLNTCQQNPHLLFVSMLAVAILIMRPSTY